MTKTRTASNPLGVLGAIKSATLIQFPAGTWGYVGRVPAYLRFRRQDGVALTDKDVSNAAIAGPRMAGLETRSWVTKEEAEKAVKEATQ